MKTLRASFLLGESPAVVRRALSFLLRGGKGRVGARRELEEVFEKRFEGTTATAFFRGRDALAAGLRALKVEGGEVICQAFTCVSVPLAIRAAGATPVFADIDDSLNLAADSLEKKISSRTRAVILQHTFGVPADLGKILPLLKARGIPLLEDCAHALGARWEGKGVGSFGEAAIFSFGQGKVLAGAGGGVLILAAAGERSLTSPSSESSSTGKSARLLDSSSAQPDLISPAAAPANRFPSKIQQLKSLLLPPTAALAKKLYDAGAGKATAGKLLARLFRHAKIWPPILSSEEKSGAPGKEFGMPEALAELSLLALKEEEGRNRARRENSKRLRAALPNLDFQKVPAGAEPIFLREAAFLPSEEAAEASFPRAKKEKVLLGDWYRQLVAPAGAEPFGCSPEECPRAADLAARVVNLPNFPGISEKELARVAKIFSEEGKAG